MKCLLPSWKNCSLFPLIYNEGWSSFLYMTAVRQLIKWLGRKSAYNKNPVVQEIALYNLLYIMYNFSELFIPSYTCTYTRTLFYVDRYCTFHYSSALTVFFTLPNMLWPKGESAYLANLEWDLYSEFCSSQCLSCSMFFMLVL